MDTLLQQLNSVWIYVHVVKLRKQFTASKIFIRIEWVMHLPRSCSKMVVVDSSCQANVTKHHITLMAGNFVATNEFCHWNRASGTFSNQRFGHFIMTKQNITFKISRLHFIDLSTLNCFTALFGFLVVKLLTRLAKMTLIVFPRTIAKKCINIKI